MKFRTLLSDGDEVGDDAGAAGVGSAMGMMLMLTDDDSTEVLDRSNTLCDTTGGSVLGTRRSREPFLPSPLLPRAERSPSMPYFNMVMRIHSRLCLEHRHCYCWVG